MWYSHHLLSQWQVAADQMVQTEQVVHQEDEVDEVEDEVLLLYYTGEQLQGL